MILEISDRKKGSWNEKSPHQSPCKHLHEWAWWARWPISRAARRCAVFELRLSAWRMTRALTLVLGSEWKLELHVKWCDMMTLASCRDPPWSRSLTNISCPDTCLAMENPVSPLPSLRFATLPIMLVRIPCCMTVHLLGHLLHLTQIMENHDPRHPSHQAALRGVKERWSKICSLFLSPLPSTLSCWAPLFAAPCRSRPKWAQFWASFTALTWKDCMSFSPGSSPCRPASSPSLRLSVVSAPIFPKRRPTTQRAVTWTMEDSCWPSSTSPRNSCKNPGAGVQPHTPCKTPLWLAQLFNWSFDIAQQCTHTCMIAKDLSGQSDLARASDSQHYFTWTTWFLQSTSSRAQRRQASAPWAPPCSTPSFYQAFQISWIDRALQYQLTFNKPTAQPSCCKGAFLLQRPYGFFVLCFTEIARFVVVKRPRCAKGHRHPVARFLAFEATSTLTAPVTQNLTISTSAAHSSSGDQLNRFVPHVRITTNYVIALVRLAQALLSTGSFWLVFILLGPMHPFVPLSQVLQVSLAESNHEFHSSLCLHVSATQASNFRSVWSTQTWRQHPVPCEPSTHLSSPVEQESALLLNAPALPNSSAFSLAHAVCSLLERHLRPISYAVLCASTQTKFRSVPLN